MPRTAAELRAVLSSYYALQVAAATNGGIAEYSADSGQGRQTVKRIGLAEINQTINGLEAELAEAEAEEAGYTPGVVSYAPRRY